MGKVIGGKLSFCSLNVARSRVCARSKWLSASVSICCQWQEKATFIKWKDCWTEKAQTWRKTRRTDGVRLWGKGGKRTEVLGPEVGTCLAGRHAGLCSVSAWAHHQCRPVLRTKQWQWPAGGDFLLQDVHGCGPGPKVSYCSCFHFITFPLHTYILYDPRHSACIVGHSTVLYYTKVINLKNCINSIYIL